jgi:hypothetical protein
MHSRPLHLTHCWTSQWHRARATCAAVQVYAWHHEREGGVRATPQSWSHFRPRAIETKRVTDPGYTGKPSAGTVMAADLPVPARMD